MSTWWDVSELLHATSAACGRHNNLLLVHAVTGLDRKWPWREFAEERIFAIASRGGRCCALPTPET